MEWNRRVQQSRGHASTVEKILENSIEEKKEHVYVWKLNIK